MEIRRFGSYVSYFSFRQILLFAFILGAISAFALPPYFIFPVLFLSFPLLLLFTDMVPSSKGNFWIGWWFGFGHFTFGLYWIAISLLVDIKQFFWLMPFAIFGISAILAIYIGLLLFLLKLTKLSSINKLMAFSILWVVIEILRSNLFTGFPWNLLGYVLNFDEKLIQIAAIFGIFGLSLITVFVVSSPYIYLVENSPKKYLGPVLSAIALLSSVYLFGQFRLETNPTRYTGVYARLVQPNISQHNKHETGKEYENFHRLMQLSAMPYIKKPSLVIWPESAFNYAVFPGSKILEVIRNIIPSGSYLVTGTTRLKGPGDISDIWNSIHVIDMNGKPVYYYDKFHLVPFGEYVPMAGILPMTKITQGRQDFSVGEGLETINIAGSIPAFSPLVCYEAIFPGNVRKSDAKLMINLTNDAWYLDSSGPYQHFEMVRMRAVEEGVPLIRVANTGISGVIDAYGRVLKSKKLMVAGIIDANIPKATGVKTFFARYGNGPVYTILLILFIFLLPEIVMANLNKK